MILRMFLSWKRCDHEQIQAKPKREKLASEKAKQGLEFSFPWPSQISSLLIALNIVMFCAPYYLEIS